MELAVIICGILGVIISVIVCLREVLIQFYNPLPRFTNGDKRMCDIVIIKTRDITYEIDNPKTKVSTITEDCVE